MSTVTPIDTLAFFGIYELENTIREKSKYLAELDGVVFRLTIKNPNGDEIHLHPDFKLTLTGFAGNISD